MRRGGGEEGAAEGTEKQPAGQEESKRMCQPARKQETGSRAADRSNRMRTEIPLWTWECRG